MIYIGIDNGVSGSIGGITTDGRLVVFQKMPTFSEQDYTKTKKNITRVDVKALRKLMQAILHLEGDDPDRVRVIIERPMVNPTRFKATGSALRCLEAVLIALESLDISKRFVDSREWQKVLLPAGAKGEELKKASYDIGARLFPRMAKTFQKHGDADGLLMAEAARRGKW